MFVKTYFVERVLTKMKENNKIILVGISRFHPQTVDCKRTESN